MDLKGQGFEATVIATEQTDEWLLGAAAEIAEAAADRGLEIPAFAGGTAVEATTETPIDPAEAKEAVTGQLDTAFSGYQTVVEQLNDGRKKKERVDVADPETVEAEFEAWFTEGRATYIAERMEADPELEFTLVATPNVTATADEIIALARQFGGDQPYKTDVWAEIYGKYTPEQLSGTNPEDGTSVKFRLIPNKLDADMYGTVAQQRAQLEKIQADTPFVGVQSVLDDVVAWNTLRANEDRLNTGAVSERTYARHFDMPNKRLVGWQYVPDSFVHGSGRPFLYGSLVDVDDHARVSVG